MMNNKLLWACIAAAVLGSVAAFWVWRTPPAVVREQSETARRIEDIRENFKKSVEYGEKIINETKKKVVVNRERVVERVRRVSDDAVADLLNAELVLWRVEDGSAGLDDS